jgi:[acyl-carrier-protein] S-malonyltransferase
MICLMYGGQGSQFVGMLDSFIEHDPSLLNLINQASRQLDIDLLSALTKDETLLDNTLYTQPAMLIFYKVLTDQLLKYVTPDSVMGLSLGEYGAYLASNVVSFEDAIKLIYKRAQLMELEATKKPGKMSAIINLETSKLENIIKSFQSVVIANYNTYGQLVISGSEDEILKVNNLAKEAGAKRALLLNTSGAFHSPLMSTAAKGFKDVLNDYTFNQPSIPLYLNTTGLRLQNENLKDEMSKQIDHSVRFISQVEQALADGMRTFIEIGPKTVLKRFVTTIAKTKGFDVTVLSISNYESYKNVLKEMNYE